MNRRQKIIVSITGITIVLLTLIGLTYAYFLTRITGNENPKSISVTTANLELLYGDGTTTVLEPDTKLIPSSTEVGTKDFTVTNNGEDTSYTVLIEDTITKYASAGSYKNDDGSIVTYTKDQPTEFLSNDFRYTLTCTITSTDASRNGKSCDGVSEQKLFPINGGVITSNDIKKGDVHTYELKFWYIDTGLNQSKDMNKSYQAKVNIVDIRENNPYAVGEESVYEKSLAYNIINNSLLKTNGTELTNTPLSKPLSDDSWEYTKTPDPTTFDYTLENATDYYITYSDDYKMNKGGCCGEPQSYVLINKDGSAPVTVKYTGSDMASTLKGKYAIWNTNKEEAENLSQKFYDIYKISTNESDMGTRTLKYTVINSSIRKSVENVLTTIQDNLGTSYYYRGGVEDNYVLFNNMCFRIVRIEGDGSVKLTLSGEVSEGAETCEGLTDTSAFISNGKNVSYGFKGETIEGKSFMLADYENGELKQTLEAWFESKFKSNNLLTTEGEKIKNDTWCLGGSDNYRYNSSGLLLTNYNSNSWYYAAGVIRKTPDLTCGDAEDEITSMVGSLTMDEVALAGAIYEDDVRIPIQHYLTENARKNYWTLSRSDFMMDFDEMSIVTEYGGITIGVGTARPAITLVPNTEISKGVGTKTNPYIIDIN